MPYHLLLADDDAAITAGLCRAIESTHPGVFTIHEATSGDELMRLLCVYPTSLIISDIKMPGLNGLQCLAMIREQQLPCEVVLLSGYDDYSLIRRALKLYAYDYLLKPVHIDSFLCLINDLLPRLATLIPRTAAPPDPREVPEPSPYFDKRLPETPLSGQELAEQLQTIVRAMQALDGESMCGALDAFFYGCHPDVWDEQTVKSALIQCISELMECIPAMIRIIGDFKLSEYDAVNSIRNLPTFSQLHARLRQILKRYLERLEISTEKPDQYVIRRAKEYIHRHYMENLALETLAGELHMNPNYFSALFRQWTNTTFREYLRSVRIRQSIRLMESGHMKLYEIAERVGYQNASHFNRAFKEVMGVTPSVWAMHHTRRSEPHGSQP